MELERAGDYSGALELLLNGDHELPRSWVLKRSLVLYARLGQTGPAWACLAQLAQRKRPLFHWPSYIASADALAARGQHADAERVLRHTLGLRGNVPHRAVWSGILLKKLGQCLMAQRRVEEAAEAFASAIPMLAFGSGEVHALWIEAHTTAAWCEQALGREEEAARLIAVARQGLQQLDRAQKFVSPKLREYLDAWPKGAAT